MTYTHPLLQGLIFVNAPDDVDVEKVVMRILADVEKERDPKSRYAPRSEEDPTRM